MTNKEQKALIAFYDYCHGFSLPFAFYRLAEANSVKIIAQTNPGISSSLKQGKPGFVFAPFVLDKSCKNVFIRAQILADATNLPALDFAERNSGKAPLEVAFKHVQSGKQEFKNYVSRIRRGILKGKLNKVVAARVLLKKKPSSFEPVAFFEKLCKIYPSAFVSLVYTPQYGLWIGASPEILLNADRKAFKTYSLAGTKANNAGNKRKAWGEKEKEEQKLVSDFIVKRFKKVTRKTPIVNGPVTVAAGNLLHLRSTFTYKNIPVFKGPIIAAHLHPTPAVAGLPRKKAIDFILKNEPSPRAFYSGYLGPVNDDGNLNLFVNLRCMQVLENKLAIYAGCGVTKDSNPEKEWKESKIKTETLLNVLKE